MVRAIRSARARCISAPASTAFTAPTSHGRSAIVSSGCIRLANEDVADLFSRVDVGTKVVVLPKNAPVMARGGDGRTGVARSVGTYPRPLAAVPQGRQAMNLTAPQLN